MGYENINEILNRLNVRWAYLFDELLIVRRINCKTQFKLLLLTVREINDLASQYHGMCVCCTTKSIRLKMYL